MLSNHQFTWDLGTLLRDSDLSSNLAGNPLDGISSNTERSIRFTETWMCMLLD